MDDEFREMDLNLASAECQIKKLHANLSDRVAQELKLKKLAQDQRNNPELWKLPMTAFGFEMQQALRELHIAILGK